MKNLSDVFKSIRFAKMDTQHDKSHKGGSQDDEEHYSVGEKEFNQQVKHAKKRAMQEQKKEDPPFDGPYKKTKPVKNSDGTTQSPMSRVRELAKRSMKNRMQEEKKDEYDEGEYDREGDMAKSDLRSIIANAKRLHDMLKDDDNLPEWVQSKITKAEDYISTVANYMTAEMSEAFKMPPESVADKMARNQAERRKKSGLPDPSHYLKVSAQKKKELEDMKKEEVEIEESMQQTLRKYVPGYAKKQIDKKMDAQAYAPGDSIKKTVDKDVNYGRYKKIQDKLKKEDVDLDEARFSGLKPNFNKKPVMKHYGEEEPNEKDEIKNSYHKEKKQRIQNALEKVRQERFPNVKEEVVQEGRPSQRHPLEGHDYHKKSNAELIGIAKDAHAAAEAMKSHSPRAENKYRDQANDSATVRYFRQKSGMPDWYKKKYGHMKEELEQLEEKNEPTNPALWSRAKSLARSKFDVYPCVPLDSLAISRKGPVSHDELEIGDEILTYNMQDDKLEWKPVQHKHYYEDAPLLEIGKPTGFSIRCTPNHKWVITKPTGNELVETKDLNTHMKILMCSVLKNESSLMIENWSKKDNWIEKILSMNEHEREIFLASSIVYDGWDKGASTKIKDRHTFGFVQKEYDHLWASLLASYLNGYYVNSSERGDMVGATYIRNKKYHSTQNLYKKDAGSEDVWCPTTENETWVMIQSGLITITGNSAYANGWASKWYKSKGGGWKSVSEETILESRKTEIIKKIIKKKTNIEDTFEPNPVMSKLTGRTGK